MLNIATDQFALLKNNTYVLALSLFNQDINHHQSTHHRCPVSSITGLPKCFSFNLKPKAYKIPYDSAIIQDCLFWIHFTSETLKWRQHDKYRFISP